MRIAYIDKLKGLTIALVVMGHIMGSSIGAPRSFGFIGSFHMPLFIFLSGIFAYKGLKQWNMREVGEFLRKKAMRLLLPFFVVGGLFCALLRLSTDRSIWSMIAGYWFLPALFYDMVFGLIAVLAAHFTPLRIVRSRLILNALYGIAMYFILSVLYLKGVQFPFFLHAVKLFPFFYAGALFGLSEKARALIVHNNWVYTLSVVIYFALVLTETSVDFFTLPGPFAIVILMNLFARHDAKIPQWLATVGEYSLEIYVFHWFFFPSMPWLKDALAMPATENILNNYNFVPTLMIFTLLVAGVVAVCMLLGAIIRHSSLLSIIILGGRFDKKPKQASDNGNRK